MKDSQILKVNVNSKNLLCSACYLNLSQMIVSHKVLCWGSQKTTFPLIKHDTFSLRRVGVKGNSDNVTKYKVFFLRSSLRVVS